MKYAFKGRDSGLIEIRLEQKNNDITLTLQDNCNGLPEGFDMDTQTGFGLLLIKMLTEQFDGKFTIENNDGTKSTLRFSV
jgi:two-component sensor histidine kinase